MRKDRIYFLAKDPHWTFIWWDITPETLSAIQSQMDGQIPPWILRISEHDVLDDARIHYTFDVPVVGATDHWYLNIWQSDRTYHVEIGFKPQSLSVSASPAPQEDAFCAIARSNTIHLPPDGPSMDAEAWWSTLDLQE